MKSYAEKLSKYEKNLQSVPKQIDPWYYIVKHYV